MSALRMKLLNLTLRGDKNALCSLRRAHVLVLWHGFRYFLLLSANSFQKESFAQANRLTLFTTLLALFNFAKCIKLFLRKRGIYDQ